MNMQTLRNKGLTRGGSNVIYNTITKYFKWLIINCVINETWGLYYVFKGEIRGWLHQTLQIKDLHGNAKESFDDLFSIQKVCSRWNFSHESTFVSSKWDGSHVTIEIIDQT